MLVQAATYDGSSSRVDYKAHFETCAEINNWTNTEKGLYLAVTLRGQAQSVMVICQISRKIMIHL